MSRIDLPEAFYDAVRKPVFSGTGGRLTQEQVDNMSRFAWELRRRRLLKNQSAAIMGQVAPETAFTFAPVEEGFYISEDWDKAEAWRRRNLRYYPWYGRGHIQLTWEDNYKRLGKRLGLDLTTDPKVVMEWDNSVEICVTGMMEGLFTRHALPQYVNETKSDYANARRVVNGTDSMYKIAGYCRAFEKGLAHVDWETDEEPPEPPVEVDPRIYELTQVIRDASTEIDAILRGEV